MTRLFLVLSALFFGFILWIVFLADTGRPSVFFDLVKAIPYGDKVGHACLFGTLTFGINLGLSFRRWKILRLNLHVGTIFVVAFVVLEELSQARFPNRTLDPFDLLADAVGITAATVLLWLVERRRKRRSTAALAA
ncbi:MAG: VanZ family protein [Fibrobacteres bacterium]|jgi:VanZ family protein|nr:VanZ family protein [Fibrobacterota bacterium]